MTRLEGRVAIVTGAGRGIGKAEATAFAAEGAAVVVNDVDAGAAAQTVEEIVAAGGSALAFVGDASTWPGAQALVQTALDSFGGLHILMNNAGFLRDAVSWELSETDWRSVLDVHVNGHFAPSHFALRHWHEQANAGHEVDARIIMTSSEAALYGNANESNYGAAKGAIAALTVILAREAEHLGVTVNAICPRARTPATAEMFEDIMKVDPGAFDPFDPANITPFVTWLASPQAAHVSGQLFVVFGGEVRLMQRWQPASRIVKDRRWTLDELDEQMAQLFGDRDPGVPPFGAGSRR